MKRFKLNSNVSSQVISTKTLLIALFTLIGLYFRLHHIDFGLPHSFHADEPEIAEFAIKYTYEFKDIIKEKNYYKLIPVSYVYGTFPAYFFTVSTMIFSKFSNILNVPFDKTSIYIFLRSLNAILSAILIPTGILLYKQIFPQETKPSRTKATLTMGSIFTAFLIALNWKLIVHAHYLNVDIVITVLLTLAYLTITRYSQKTSDTKYTILTGLFVGLAVGTKVTAALGLPLFLYMFLSKKDYRGMFAFIFIILGTFFATNPFSLAFANDFAFRVYTLTIKENGLVFDSADTGIFKYIFGLNYLVTPLVLLFFIYGILASIKTQWQAQKSLAIFFLGTIFVYLLFYTMGSRRVDRWLLPVVPIVLMYAAYGMQYIKTRINTTYYVSIVTITLMYYSFFAILLLVQFQKNTPKSQAYLWARDNLNPASNKYAITKEGLDPLNKLKGINVLNYNSYEAETGQFSFPDSPKGYDYVILSSRPLEFYKNPVVAQRFPFYTEKWAAFENTVLDENQFRLIKSFVLPKPNLIELSDVYIYEKNLVP